MFDSLFEIISTQSIDKLAEQRATELRKIVLHSRGDFTLESAIASTYKFSKYSQKQTSNSSGAMRKEDNNLVEEQVKSMKR
jgi:hypothetical protein